MIIRLNTQIAWKAERDPETDGWVGECEPLKVTAYGDTWEELSASIAEIQAALFTELLMEGQLEKFLRNHGWKLAMPVPVQPPDHEPIEFDIPTQITDISNHGHAQVANA